MKNGGKGPMSKKTAALYARFSSDLQKDRSIDDQFALCEQIAKRHDLKIVKRFSDKARSGATLFDRDGIAELIKAAQAKQFDVIVVEALDRLSRDQADLAYLHKRLEFAGVTIITGEGATTLISVGLHGIMGQMFLKGLGDKVRRGHNGRARDGKFPGAVTYGYRIVQGKPAEREIDPETAAIVRRIFQEYASGVSPREIALKLTREGVPSPKGAVAWNHQTFIGGGGAKRGMLGNPIYIGEIVWNTRHTVINPETGKKTKRKTAEDEWVNSSAPHLRIIPQDLWDAANKVRTDRAVAKFGPDGRLERRPVIPRNGHWLAGLLRCGACGGHMRIAQNSRDGSPRVACAAAHQHSTCQHTKSYDLDTLQGTILKGMREHLTDPEAIARLSKGYREEAAKQERLDRTTRSEEAAIRRQLTNIDVKINRLVAAIRDTDSPHLVKALTPLEIERSALTERLRLSEARSNVVALHPAAIQNFCNSVQQLHDALAKDPDAPANRAAFRNLLDSIIVHPTAKRMPYEVSPMGRMDALLGLNLFPTTRSSSEILGEQGVSSSYNGNTEKTGLPLSVQRVVPFGRWRAAA